MPTKKFKQEEQQDVSMYKEHQETNVLDKLPLEIIQERQSEFSSSLNTNNNFGTKLNSQRSKSRQAMMKPPNFGVDLNNFDFLHNKIQSARDSPREINDDFNKL